MLYFKPEASWNCKKRNDAHIIIQKENGQVEKDIKAEESKLDWNVIRQKASEELGMQEANKITVDPGKTITADLLKSHIKLEENQTIDGFYTDANFTTAFDFNVPINADTTVYAKISKVETTAPETNTPVKDETPKTGVENYLGIAVLTVLFSTIAIICMKKKYMKG